jgi:hypothetical protein
MNTENLEIIKDNLLKLFGIMNTDSGMVFVRALNKFAKGEKKPIGEIIKEADEKDIMYLIKIAMKAKFKEQPKPYFDNIVSILKLEAK